MKRISLLAAATAAGALIASTAASAHLGPSKTITIIHAMRGCHVWQLAGHRPVQTLTITVKAGTTLRFVNDDVMPHKLIEQKGPKLTLFRPNMNHTSAVAAADLDRRGTYRFTTKPGEDYPSMPEMHTIGEDYVLHLTVHVK